MGRRIAIWAGVGALVVFGWTLASTALFSSGSPPPALRDFVYLTCPISFAGNHRLSIYFVLLANAATYALIGAAVEYARLHFAARLSH